MKKNKFRNQKDMGKVFVKPEKKEEAPKSGINIYVNIDKNDKEMKAFNEYMEDKKKGKDIKENEEIIDLMVKDINSRTLSEENKIREKLGYAKIETEEEFNKFKENQKDVFKTMGEGWI